MSKLNAWILFMNGPLCEPDGLGEDEKDGETDNNDDTRDGNGDGS